MKLYLSSIGIPNSKALLDLLPESNSMKVAIVANAWDVYPEERRKSEVESLQKIFVELGFETRIIDIKTLRGNELRDTLSDCSLLWVMGGNSFYLNYLVNKSGMSDFVTSLLKEGLVYGGESAGAVLACPTLHGVELMDNPKEAPETIWAGLGLVDFGIVPHWGMDKYAETLQKCKEEMAKHTRVKTITNDQALIIVDDQVKLVGKVQT